MDVAIVIVVVVMVSSIVVDNAVIAAYVSAVVSVEGSTNVLALMSLLWRYLFILMLLM